MSQCEKCGKAFECGMADAGAASPCWCVALPPLPKDRLGRDAAGCYCPACLKQLLDECSASATGSAAA